MDTYSKIAYLKIVKKQIEKEIEQLQKNLRAEEVYVSLGKFVRTSTFIMKVDKPKLLKSIFNNEDLEITIDITGLSNEDLVKFADLDDILKTRDFHFADILGNNFSLNTKSKN
jgi:hypothetical protein